MTVAVSGSSPTGTVCLYFDASSQASACAIPLVSGQLSYTATLSPTSSGAVGNHSLKVDYSGDANNQASNATAAYTVTAQNALPSVSLTTPLNNATYVIPDNVILSANASDSDGSIAKVEFFNGTTLLATLTQAPYTFNWTNVAAGAYTITAKATDDLGASTLSAPVNMRMNGKPQTSYYIYTDHLNTPRAVSNQDGTVVWQWDNSDPFGGNVPNQDPGSTGNAFEFNFRFPGQYYDRETNLYYNYFRDYDPTTGRYVQSDSIGLAGGINTYSYVGGNPVSFVDPLGLLIGATLGGAMKTTLDEAAAYGAPGNAAAGMGALAGAAAAGATVAVGPMACMVDKVLTEKDSWITIMGLLKALNRDAAGTAPKVPSIPPLSPSSISRGLREIRNQSSVPAPKAGASPPP